MWWFFCGFMNWKWNRIISHIMFSHSSCSWPMHAKLYIRITWRQDSIPFQFIEIELKCVLNERGCIIISFTNATFAICSRFQMYRLYYFIISFFSWETFVTSDDRICQRKTTQSKKLTLDNVCNLSWYAWVRKENQKMFRNSYLPIWSKLQPL